jgi:hypothetical protein
MDHRFLWQDLGGVDQPQPPLPVNGNARAPAIAFNNKNAAGNLHLELEEDGNMRDVELWNMNHVIDGGSAVEGKSNVQCDMVRFIRI